MDAAGRESPRRATYFSLLRQRNVGKRKATPLSATLRCAAGNLRWRASAGVWLNSPAAQTTPALIPPPPTIAGAYRRGWVPGNGIAIAALGLLSCPLSRVRERARVRVDEASPTAKNHPHPNPLPHAGEGAKPASRTGSQRSDASRTPEPSPPPLHAPRSGGFGGSGLALFERSEFRQTPPNLSTAGCPKRSAGTQVVGAISLSLVSLVRTRESDSPAGATTGQRRTPPPPGSIK